MSDDRKTFLWPLIVALLIALPVLYVAAFGPACWLADRDALPYHIVYRGYLPLAKLMANVCPDQVCDSITNYGRWAGSDFRPLAEVLIGHERICVARRNSAKQ